MASFKCRKCGSEVNRLVYYKGEDGCDLCINVREERNPNLHMRVNRFKRGMTYADKMRIVTRTQGSDGKWRAAKQWRSNGY